MTNNTGGVKVTKSRKPVGTKGDQLTKEVIKKILEEGTWDKNPRPHYEDTYLDSEYDYTHRTIKDKNGNIIKLSFDQEVKAIDGGYQVWTPAHTLSVNHMMLKYDLSKGESPLITLRPIAVKNSFAEFLWIYQQESNDLVEFDSLIGKETWNENQQINNWWKDWAIKNPDGTFNLNLEGHPHIGHCYGETVADHDLMKTLINGIKNDPDGRRHIICMWQIEDFKDPHGLKPCAFMTIWNVRHGRDGKDYLDMMLVQRSSDFMTAGCINQVQYVALQTCIAKHLGYIPGQFAWAIDNVQIYDRHIEQAEIMLEREPVDCEPVIEVAQDDFYKLTPADIKITGYPREEIKEKNPQLTFQLGI